MLRLGLLGQLCRVGRKKRERRIVVSAVLGEVEMDAADEMPRRVLALQKLLDRHLRFGKFRSKRLGDLGPERFEDRGRHGLGAANWPSRSGEGLELAAPR